MIDRVVIKDVKGYEGLYVIDSLGNVLSLPRKQGRHFVNKYKVISTKVNRLGYTEVTLCKDGGLRTRLLHRLLAEHFIPNPDNLNCVNHINGHKSDNRLDNLEWCTRSYNTRHAYAHNLGGFRDHANAELAKINSVARYTLVVLEKDGNITQFKSVRDASSFLGTHPDNVTRAIRNRERGLPRKVLGYVARGLKESRANGETPSGQSRGSYEP